MVAKRLQPREGDFLRCVFLRRAASTPLHQITFRLGAAGRQRRTAAGQHFDQHLVVVLQRETGCFGAFEDHLPQPTRPAKGRSVQAAATAGASSSASLASRSNAQRPLDAFPVDRNVLFGGGEVLGQFGLGQLQIRPATHPDFAAAGQGRQHSKTSLRQGCCCLQRLRYHSLVRFKNFGTSAVTHRSRFLFVSKARRS